MSIRRRLALRLLDPEVRDLALRSGEPVPVAGGGGAAAAADAGSPAPVPPPRATVVGPPAAVPAVAAAAANELRVRAHAPAALVLLWRPVPSAVLPRAPSAPAARRLLAAVATELPGSATARLAWLALPADPAAAARAAGELRAATTAPTVLAIAGPRPAALEPLVANLVCVLGRDAGPALTAAVRSAATTVPPLPNGPARWSALAGLARLRDLGEGAR
jgi:hypothetical protein